MSHLAMTRVGNAAVAFDIMRQLSYVAESTVLLAR